jgi:hypothetical protein
MKKYIVISAFCFGMTCVKAQAPAQKPAPAKAPATTTTAKTTQTATTADPGYKFDVTTHDYGTIKKGADPYCEFQLTNTGKDPLIIKEAHGSCGCTVPEYTKEPIQPGQTVTIKVRYDTNRPGPFEKTVTMTFEGKDNPAILHIHGVVEVPPAETPFPGPGSTPAGNAVPVNNN